MFNLLDESIEMDEESDNHKEYVIDQTKQTWYESYIEKYKRRVLKEFTSSLVDTIIAEYGSESIKIWEDIKNMKIIENELHIGNKFEKKNAIEINEIENNFSELVEAFNSTHNFRLKIMLLSIIVTKFTDSALMKVFVCSEL
jgi:hypothetical protein